MTYRYGQTDSAKLMRAYKALQAENQRLQEAAAKRIGALEAETAAIRKAVTATRVPGHAYGYIPHPGNGDFGPEAYQRVFDEAYAWHERHAPVDELTARRRLQEATEEATRRITKLPTIETRNHLGQYVA